MSEIVINVTKVDEVVTINATPNVTQILVNTNSGGGGAVDSVNGQTGAVILDADDISDSSTSNKFVTSAEKTAITHSNRSILDAITESFTTALKTAYDNAVTWITTNGTNILNHLSNTSNPHNVTKSQVGLSNVPNTDTTTTANITDSTNKRFVTDANLTTIGNTSGSNTGDNATNTTSNAYADAKVADAINDGVTTIAPSQNAVHDALNLKVDKSTTSIVLKNNFTPNTLTSNVTVETIVDSYDLGIAFLAVGESLKLDAEIVKNTVTSGTVQSFFYLSKVANSISVTDAVKIGTSLAIGAGGGSNIFERTFHRKSTSILSGRVGATTAQQSDKASVNNVPLNLISDATLSDYRFLIVASIYSGTGGGLTMQTNIILTKNPVV